MANRCRSVTEKIRPLRLDTLRYAVAELGECTAAALRMLEKLEDAAPTSPLEDLGFRALRLKLLAIAWYDRGPAVAYLRRLSEAGKLPIRAQVKGGIEIYGHLAEIFATLERGT